MKKIFSVLIFVSLVTGLFAEIKISKVFGPVSVFKSNAWLDAMPGMELTKNDQIKTGSGGKAEIIMDGTSRIGLTEKSNVEIGATGLESMVNLLIGKIRAKIKLAKGGKFSVRTPTSVAAIRGTEFVISDTGELFVLRGIVTLLNMIGNSSQEVGEGQGSSVGSDGNIMTPSSMTDEQKNQINQEWGEFAAGEDSEQDAAVEQGQQEEAKKEDIKNEIQALRQEIHEIVSEMKTDIEIQREIANEIKEADFATGRSLRDVHGNLVRVEQQMLRPDGQTMQFLNITKRDSYVYGGRFKYDGTSGSRLDILETKITFNKELPDQITDWPSFIADQDEDTFYPQAIYAKLTNQTDMIEFIGVSKAAGELDEEGNVLKDRSIVTNQYINGWKVDPNYDAGDDVVDNSGEATDDLWSTTISPSMKIDKDGQTKYINLFTEGYGINNDGKILSLKDFTETPENPFTVLKEIACEGIISAREGNTVTSPSFFTKGNIDLIITPDIMVAIAQKLATEAGDIADATN